jgi:hypothetical protein
MAKYSAHLSEINLQSVLLKDETGAVLIDFAKEVVGDKLSIGVIDIVESIGTTSVRGDITIDATRGEFEALQLIGNETVQFVFSSPPEEEDEDEIIITSPEFRLFDYNDSSDFTDLAKTPEGFTPRTITLKFSGKQEGDIFDTETPLPFGFVGKIAKEIPVELVGPPDPNQEEESDDCPGLINELANRYFADDDFEIEPTDNSVFISPNRFTYPSRKTTKNMNLLQLIEYCTLYAWKTFETNSLGPGVVGPPEPQNISEPYSPFGWCNYFFWQDLYGWHFKSATKMATDSQLKGIKRFTFSSNILAKDRIYKLDPISDFSKQRAFSTGVLYSYHTRIEPNYSDVYSRFLDEDHQYVKLKYKYNYGTDYVPIIESKKFLPNELDGKPLAEWIEEKANNELEVKDYLFGWYDDRLYNNDTQIDRIIGNGVDKNAPGPMGNTGTNSVRFQNVDSRSNLVDYNNYQDGMWQEMFDCVKVGDASDLNSDCDNLRKITKIKADTFNAKNRYKQAMSYKEKWNLYRYSVCCEVPEAETTRTTFAILKGHKKMANTSNIFEYDWAEVCIIPKAALGFVVGHEANDFNGINPWDNDIVGEEGLNFIKFSSFVTLTDDYGIRLGNSNYSSGGGDLNDSDNVDRVVETGNLSGIVHFNLLSGSDPGITAPGITGSVSWDYIKDLFDDVGGVSANGITLTFHNSQFSPFLVVEKPNGASGFTAGRRAYNLNEIMNRPILDENIWETTIGGTTTGLIHGPDGGSEPPVGFTLTDYRSTVFFQRSPVDIGYYSDLTLYDPNYDPFEQDKSGLSDPTQNTQYMVGPGVNASKGNNWTEYPAAYDAMPIGSYKKVTRDSDGNYIGGLDCTAIPIGHVVKLEFASFDEIYKLGIEGNRGIYYFSAENAHDGKCEGNNCSL